LSLSSRLVGSFHCGLQSRLIPYSGKMRDGQCYWVAIQLGHFPTCNSRPRLQRHLLHGWRLLLPFGLMSVFRQSFVGERHNIRQAEIASRLGLIQVFEPHMSDGDIDYSQFTLLELEEALAGINRQRYPTNYANLRSAYEKKAAVMAPPAPEVETLDGASDREPSSDLWSRVWGSRPVVLAVGAACFWWSYDLFSHTDSCPSGGKLIGDLVAAACENFGPAAAAGIPFVFGVAFVVLAVRKGGPKTNNSFKPTR